MSITLEGGYRLNKTRPQTTEGMLVSIVTVVFNGEKYLDYAIRSVLSQTYKNIEYIVVDGRSTDGTLNIIKNYESRIAYWKSEPDEGISDAFNKGIALATGELVGILNADDWYEPDAVSRVVAQYAPGSILHGNLQYWSENGKKDVLMKPNLNLLPQEMSLNHPTVFVSKSLYSKYGTFDLRYRLVMDYHLLLRFYKAKVRFIYIDAAITNMRLGGISSDIISCYQEILKAKNDVLGFKVTNKLYFYWMLLRFRTSKTLSTTPLSFVNKIYRIYFSPMKKEY